jgi:chorismate mutase
VAVRAIRGATQLDTDHREHLLDRVGELLLAIVTRNGLAADDVISILLTATPDLTSEFPAVAARQVGLRGVPLICAREIDVVGALPRTVRVMAHVDTARSRDQIEHVYLHGAVALSTNLPAHDPPDASTDDPRIDSR